MLSRPTFCSQDLWIFIPNNSEIVQPSLTRLNFEEKIGMSHLKNVLSS